MTRGDGTTGMDGPDRPDWAGTVGRAAAVSAAGLVLRRGADDAPGQVEVRWANREAELRLLDGTRLPAPVDRAFGFKEDQVERLADLIARRRSATFDFTPVRDGHRRLYRMTLEPVDPPPDGAVAEADDLAAVATFVDRTEDLWLRDQLDRAHAELAAATADKTQLLGKVVHELRTPLNAILGYSEMIERETFGPVGDARYGKFAGNIAEAGRHLLALVNDILDYARVSGDALALSEEPCDIAKLVETAVDMTRPTADVRGIELLSAVPPGLPALRGDPRRLTQVLVNLLSNAVKFTATGGSVLVSADRDADGRPFFAIMDTGVGIPGAALEKVMMPFGQVDAAQAGRPPGTGLGLPVVREIVKRHGGELEVMTTEGHGSVFVAKLPAERVQ
ncbi:MAG: HAMP domain-containing sensor histidine kinase [Azospirillaceae bacterium]